MHKKVLIICTSNADRSPALEKHLKKEFPKSDFRSAGINKYHCSTKGTHYLTQEDIDWSNLIVFCEQIHFDVTHRNYKIIKNSDDSKDIVLLGLGEYEKGNITSDYLTRATNKLKQILIN